MGCDRIIREAMVWQIGDKMKAAVFYGMIDLRVEERKIREVNPDMYW